MSAERDKNVVSRRGRRNHVERLWLLLQDMHRQIEENPALRRELGKPARRAVMKAVNRGELTTFEVEKNVKGLKRNYPRAEGMLRTAASRAVSRNTTKYPLIKVDLAQLAQLGWRPTPSRERLAALGLHLVPPEEIVAALGMPRYVKISSALAPQILQHLRVRVPVPPEDGDGQN